jgi:hypothetical protein
MADEEVKAEEEIVISDAPEKAEAPEPEASDEITPDVGIEALKIQLEQERLARSEAESRARAATENAARAGAEVQDSNLQLIISAIDSVNRTNYMLKRDYAAAMSAGNFEQAAEIMLECAEDLITKGKIRIDCTEPVLDDMIIGVAERPPILLTQRIGAQA